MTRATTVGRRRALQIVAGASIACFLPGRAFAQVAPQIWRGTALGAAASITLHHHDPRTGAKLLQRCVAEIERLENIFSLYRRDSALSRLNRQGFIDTPPPELVQLLAVARSFSQLTDGAFDVTVQPLWNLYTRHFRATGADSKGPAQDAVLRVLETVNYRAIDVAADRIALQGPGMAITLNGIAQGYINDKVAELLRAEGLRSVALNLGEFRGLGRHPDGRSWQIGIKDPIDAGRLAATIELENAALSTSGGYGSRFDSAGHHHHLFDPGTGRSARRYLDLSVTAPSATVADALSTGFQNLDRESIKSVIGGLSAVSVRATLQNGQVWVANSNAS